MGFFTKKKRPPPRCPECRNRKHNRELQPKIWRCAACYKTFVFDSNAKMRGKPIRPEPKQIGEDIEDVDDYEVY
jgi:ribosomal protein L37AE/L43A